MLRDVTVELKEDDGGEFAAPDCAEAMSNNGKIYICLYFILGPIGCPYFDPTL